MTKKKSKGSLIKAEASAKAELGIKASYQRKHTTNETIPPDVTRAKAAAWLDLISPITEWAGLKGDTLKAKRSLLRIQQEETLLRVAEQVREKLAKSPIVHQVPRKILIPALEKASLEDVDDDVMIEKWSSLLASAATAIRVEPRFIGILEELAGKQAECLERIAFNHFDRINFPYRAFHDSYLEFAHYNVQGLIESCFSQSLGSEQDVDAALALINSVFIRPGVRLVSSMITKDHDAWEGYDVVSNTGIRNEADFAILESLGLVRYAVLRMDLWANISIHYHHLTELGIAFCEVCSAPTVAKLRAIDDASRKAGLQFDFFETP